MELKKAIMKNADNCNGVPAVTKTSAECSLVDNPAIPLVGINGKSVHYGSSSGKPYKYENVGTRLARRKVLFERRKTIADFAMTCGMIGVGLTICETEFCIAEIFYKDTLGSILMKSFVSMTTALLLAFIVWYHYLDVKVFMIDNGMEDWRLAFSKARVLRLIVEFFVCAIHPPPGKHDMMWIAYDIENQKWMTTLAPIDVIFVLPMFLRFYLVCRVVMLHSKLFQDASSQSIGALNRIHFNFSFIFKSLMTLHPTYMLTFIISFLFILASWSFRACEMYNGEKRGNFFNSMWLISITFLSVGYGDITPISYCGRGVAVLTGIFGAASTALTVAVLTNKLELSRAEKYVHNFVIDVELDKNLKHQAANVVKEGWLAHKYSKAENFSKKLKHQQRLLQAIHRIRELKNNQRQLMDNSVSMVEMFKNQAYLMSKVESVELNLKQVYNHLSTIDAKVQMLLEK